VRLLAEPVPMQQARLLFLVQLGSTVTAVLMPNTLLLQLLDFSLS